MAELAPNPFRFPPFVVVSPQMNQWALITGASQGIGCALARLFAAEGWNVILVARDAARLGVVAEELRQKSDKALSVMVLPQDLTVPGAGQLIFAAVQRERIVVNVLVNNAGFGFQGAFVEQDWQQELDLVQVNIVALMELTRLFLPGMRERGAGRILNVASTAAFLPGPYMALYYASKAFVYSFSNAVGRELAGSGVTVTTLCPGLTATQFHARAGQNRVGGFLQKMMGADRVAEIAYRALMAGRPRVTSGLLNHLVILIAKILPTWLILRISGRFIAPPKR